MRKYVPPLTRRKRAELHEMEALKRQRAEALFQICRQRREAMKESQNVPSNAPVKTEGNLPLVTSDQTEKEAGFSTTNEKLSTMEACNAPKSPRKLQRNRKLATLKKVRRKNQKLRCVIHPDLVAKMHSGKKVHFKRKLNGRKTKKSLLNKVRDLAKYIHESPYSPKFASPKKNIIRATVRKQQRLPRIEVRSFRDFKQEEDHSHMENNHTLQEKVTSELESYGVPPSVEYDMMIDSIKDDEPPASSHLRVNREMPKQDEASSAHGWHSATKSSGEYIEDATRSRGRELLTTQRGKSGSFTERQNTSSEEKRYRSRSPVCCTFKNKLEHVGHCIGFNENGDSAYARDEEIVANNKVSVGIGTDENAPKNGLKSFFRSLCRHINY